MNLDERIRYALTTAATAVADGLTDLDYNQYRLAFTDSARAKGQSVLDELQSEPFFARKRPVFVSIGGADGEEADYLLRNSSADVAFLLEASPILAEIARKREFSRQKRLEVMIGDAAQTISVAMRRSRELVEAGEGEFRVVTCHAVIHELYDRSPTFNPREFFTDIFPADDVTTWFTCREPGVPDRWPPFILLEANCSPQQLLSLAQFIQRRHPNLQNLQHPPKIVGEDRLCLTRELGMETLAKLFYLDDFAYEVEERSTAVEHPILLSLLGLALGETALSENRASFTTRSSPTGSFAKLWREFGVHVWSIDEAGKTAPLPIPESQTRVVAWRLSKADYNQELLADVKAQSDKGGRPVRADVLIARDALRSADMALLQALLLSKGRAWIELSERDEALDVLNQSMLKDDRGLTGLWCRYLLGLTQLFSGSFNGKHYFSVEWEAAAAPHGLAPLFQAERMEFARKTGDRDEALAIANSLLGSDHGNEPSTATDLEKYVRGTVCFVLNNFLRYGGLYEGAREQIERAKASFVAGIESHAAELVHCRYAGSVCDSIKGVPTFDTQVSVPETSQRLAGALLQLSQANAAWFIDDLSRAERFVSAASAQFGEIAAAGYVKRAQTLLSLFSAWQALERGKELDEGLLGEKLYIGVSTLAGLQRVGSQFRQWFEGLRPSVAAGLLQFQKFDQGRTNPSALLTLPMYLELQETGPLRWSLSDRKVPLEQASSSIRRVLGVRDDVRIPLHAD